MASDRELADRASDKAERMAQEKEERYRLLEAVVENGAALMPGRDLPRDAKGEGA